MNSSTQFLRRLTAAVVGSCAALVATPLLAQTTATTDPVGFITLNVAGTGGSGSSKISFQGFGLTRAVEYQGSAETVGTNFVVDNDATWTDNQFNGPAGAYFLEIASGTGAGTTYDITGTVAATKRINLAQNLAAGVANGVSFKIRKHWTIAAAFGATNSAGLQGGDDSTTADQLLVWNGSGYSVFYYQVAIPALGGTGWRSASDTFADAGTQVIYPDDGVIVKRIASAAVNVVLMGAVKTGQSSFPITPGINIIANVYAAPMTLASCGLQASGITGGDDATTADQVQIWNGSGFNVYYYQVAIPALGGTGWRSASDTFTDAGTTPIPVGSSIVVKRSFGPAFDWKLPQHPPTI